MSRIQDILNKAEREGGARRTRSIGVEGAAASHAPATPAPAPRPVVEPTPIAERREARARQAEQVAPPPERNVSLDRHLVTALAPQSLAAEQYRSLRTRISRAENGRAVRVLIVTSPERETARA